MQPTIKSLRLGSKLIFGKYSANKNAEPALITWLKATPNGDFITDRAVDFLAFDAKEDRVLDNGITRRDYGNSNYALSNIHTFLNSPDESWYVPKHSGDRAPTDNYSDVSGQGCTYTDHYGFLHYFEDYERSNIVMQDFEVNGAQLTSLVRLPKLADIIGDERFNLFKKKGRRVHPSEDLFRNKYRCGTGDTTQFISYFLADKSGRFTGYVKIIDRTGNANYVSASGGLGIRPTCRLRLDARVELIADGIFELVPYEVNPIAVSTNEEIMMLLGLV